MSANWQYASKPSEEILFEILGLEQNWQEFASLTELHRQLNKYQEQLNEMLDLSLPATERLYALVDYIYDELAFSGPGHQALPESSLNNLSYAIMYRTGNYLSLTVLMRYLLRQAGFNAFVAEVENQVALVIKLSNSELVLLDVVSGGCEYIISSDDVRETMVSEVATYAKELPDEEVVKDVITAQKLTLLDEGLFEEALACVETLMELLPEDPYERRDRGLVLQHLDCGQWAKDDFDYFIKACPNDPMTMFIKLQLEETRQDIETIH